MLFRVQGSAKGTDRGNPSSHTNYGYLGSPGKVQRIQRLHCAVRVQQQRIDRMRSQIVGRVSERGISVDEDLHRDLTDVMESNNGTHYAYCSFWSNFLFRF